jgi:stalled ribosome rescue protein Dom34
MSNHIEKQEPTLIEQIENILTTTNFDKTWIGFPTEIKNKIYFSAKGRDLDIVKKFRDTFGGTSIAGSVKTIKRKMFSKKNGGYTIVYTIEEMQNILEQIEEASNKEVR